MNCHEKEKKKTKKTKKVSFNKMYIYKIKKKINKKLT